MRIAENMKLSGNIKLIINNNLYFEKVRPFEWYMVSKISNEKLKIKNTIMLSVLNKISMNHNVKSYNDAFILDESDIHFIISSTVTEIEKGEGSYI